MEKNNENLPVEVNNNFLTKLEQKKPVITDFLKRIGKGSALLGGAAAALVGDVVVSAVPGILATTAITTSVLNAAGMVLGTASIASATKGLSEFIYKHEPGLAFQSRKSLSNEILITQDILQGTPKYFKDLDKSQKGALMGLQTLIGFQRSKVDLKGTKFSIDENGQKVYDQKISTVTHGINIKNLEALEKLGYIKIDRQDDRKFGPLGKLIGTEYLFTERIGFGEIKGLRNIAKEYMAIQRGTTEMAKKDFKKITFRLTDKDIDFEELYKRANPKIFGETEKTSDQELTEEQKKENQGFRRISMMFKSMGDKYRSVLDLPKKEDGSKSTVIDIRYDKYNRPYLVYDAEKSFAQVLQDKQKVASRTSDERSDFDRLVQVEKVPEVTVDKTKMQSDKQTEVSKSSDEKGLDD